MLGHYDPSWGVPLIALIIAAGGALWGYLSDRAFTRKWGPDRK